MAYVAPITWATGTDITAARLNQDLRDNPSFLANPPCCRVYNSASISVANSADTYLTFNSERYDTDTMHSTSTNTGRITFTRAGKYHVAGCIEIAASATGSRAFFIRLNGTTKIVQTLVPAAVLQTIIVVSCDYQFSAADYIELGCFQNSGGALNATATLNSSPEFWASWFSF